MSTDDLKDRFPDLIPIQSPPALWRLNGFGSGMYGRRDFDEETGSYIKTCYISALWIPIVPVAAYRVVDADEGWYFLGRVPVSNGARLWAVAVVLLTLSLILRVDWNVPSSPRKVGVPTPMERAAEHQREGRLVEAARIYADLARREDRKSNSAATGFRQVIEEAASRSTAQEAARVFRVVAPYYDAVQSDCIAPVLLQRIEQAADRVAPSDPEGALELLRIAQRLDPSSAGIRGKRRASWRKQPRSPSAATSPRSCTACCTRLTSS